jgi:hypothetical protein
MAMTDVTALVTKVAELEDELARRDRWVVLTETFEAVGKGFRGLSYGATHAEMNEARDRAIEQLQRL